MKISENALLTTLRVGVWGGRSFGQEEETGKQYRKRLIAPQFLHGIGTVVSTARRVHRALTLPWDDDSTRILSAVGYDKYDKQMEILQAKFDGAVVEFYDVLPTAIKEARKRLKKEFSNQDYPTLEELATKFWFKVEYNKVPEAADFKVKLPGASSIASAIHIRTEERVRLAMQALYHQISEATLFMAEKLEDFTPAEGAGVAKGVFRDSLIFNMEKFISSLVALNLTSATNIHELRLRMLELVKYSPEALRTNPHARAEIATLARSLGNKARSYYERR